MLVRELIERLSKEDPDAIVFLVNDKHAAEVTECSRVRFSDAIAIDSDYSNMFELL